MDLKSPLESEAAARPALSRADRHRGWLLGLPYPVDIGQGDIPLICAVGGGKGGVGKSVVSANLAAVLAQRGLSVLVVDLDFGGANLHTHLGVSAPKASLADFVAKGARSFQDCALPTAIAGVTLVAGGRDDAWISWLGGSHEAFFRIWQALLRTRADQRADVVILDLGAGTHRHTIDFFTAAHLGVLTVTPEPTSIENAYVFLRTVLWQFIENAGRHFEALGGSAQTARTLLAALRVQDLGSRGYAGKLGDFARLQPQFMRMVGRALTGRSIGVLVNQARSQQDIDLGRSMEMICQRYFGFESRYLGYLNYDEAAWKALRNRHLVVQDFPHSLFAKRLGQVATQVLAALSC